MLEKTYITSFAGNRDSYQVPMALYEHGLLYQHVCDFYTPDWIRRFASPLAPRLLRRCQAGLPSALTRWDFPAIWVQARGRRNDRDMVRQHFETERSLSRHAAKIARRSGAQFFLHSGIAYWAFNAVTDRKRLLFQFHPHPASNRELLEADYARNPEVRHSFETEYDSIPLAGLPEQRLLEWQLADYIFCASTFTKRSLELQGCAPERISVIPYGIDLPTTRPLRRPKNPKCRFLFVGQGVQRKGLHHLLKAWRKADLPGCELTLVCSRIDPGIVPLADQPGIRVLSHMPYDRLMRIFEDADIFVMPSIIEGFGQVYLEALASGLFCIGTRNTGLPDLLPPKDVAAVIDASNEEQLIEAMTNASAAWRRGEISRPRIAEFAAGHPWERFRTELASQADQLLK
jgi:glycosyltransferase involved in cell wall biosynthesis